MQRSGMNSRRAVSERKAVEGRSISVKQSKGLPQSSKTHVPQVGIGIPRASTAAVAALSDQWWGGPERAAPEAIFMLEKKDHFKQLQVRQGLIYLKRERSSRSDV